MSVPFTVTADVIAATRKVLPTSDDFFLLEGVKPAEGGIVFINIQTGPDSKRGELCFMNPNDGPQSAIRYPLDGRPGFVQQVESPGNKWLVGIDRRLQVIELDGPSRRWHSVNAYDVPEELVPKGKTNLTINDGAVDPTMQGVVFGFKETTFGESGDTGCLLYFRKGKFSLIRSGEVCPNGNFWVRPPRRGATVWLYHIETRSQTLYRAVHDLESGKIGKFQPYLNFADPSHFPQELFHSRLMPDGCTSFEVDGMPKVVVCIFNPVTDTPTADLLGLAMQFDVSGRKPVFEGVYKLPGAPRVTCATVYQALGKAPELIFTTADEGLLAARNAKPEELPNVGCLFRCSLDHLQGNVRCLHPTKFQNLKWPT